MNDSFIKEMSSKYENYLSDESSAKGRADSISMPQSVEELREIMLELKSRGESEITIQGGLTGINGHAVPDGGHIINMSKMNKILGGGKDSDGDYYVDVEAGVTLDELNEDIVRRFKGENLYWKPMPSEGSACIGGIVASGAFGMNIASCGEACEHICELKYVDENANIGSISEAEAKSFLESKANSTCITSLRLKLSKRGESVWGVAFFFDDAESAAACADALQKELDDKTYEGAEITALEYIDRGAMELVESSRESLPSLEAVPFVSQGVAAIIYAEINGEDAACEEAISDIAQATASYGSDPDEAWALVGYSEIEKFHIYRHAVTEAATQYMAAVHAGDDRIHLLAADIRMQEVSFSELLGLFSNEDGISSARKIICGSISAPVIRALILSDNYEEFIGAQDLMAAHAGR